LCSRSQHDLLINYIVTDGLRTCSMTWNGKQGFQKPIKSDSFLVDGVGTSHTERGLSYFEVELSGRESNTSLPLAFPPNSCFQGSAIFPSGPSIFPRHFLNHDFVGGFTNYEVFDGFQGASVDM
jgi:hypothetical protein